MWTNLLRNVYFNYRGRNILHLFLMGKHYTSNRVVFRIKIENLRLKMLFLKEIMLGCLQTEDFLVVSGRHKKMAKIKYICMVA